jgi:hypothetical protein
MSVLNLAYLGQGLASLHKLVDESLLSDLAELNPLELEVRLDIFVFPEI